MKAKKFILVLSFCLLLTSVFVANASYAYVLLGNKWSSSSITYHYDNYNSSRFQTYISSGANAWNSAGTDASLSKSGSYNVYCTEVSMPNVTWDGLATLNSSFSYYSSGSISLNTAATETWSSNGALQSVAVHEFGHIFGLDENGTTQTIMNAYTWGSNSRYGHHGLTTPQTDDINGVNFLY